MRITSRRKATITFLVLGVGLAGVAVAVGFGWIILNWREGIEVFVGVIFFGAITAGLVLNTIFLIREIRRNEQHDSFINAVTHELKTPIASIRLYLQTLQYRDVDEGQRREFYRRMRTRLGAPKAITATAHKLARIVFHLITTKEVYDESVFARAEEKCQQRAKKRLAAQASALGFNLVPVEP